MVYKCIIIEDKKFKLVEVIQVMCKYNKRIWCGIQKPGDLVYTPSSSKGAGHAVITYSTVQGGSLYSTVCYVEHIYYSLYYAVYM